MQPPPSSILVSCNPGLYNIMASAVHAASPSYPPPPNYSQTSTDGAVNGINHSHPVFNSFDGAQSVASTPTPTPPNSRHQPIMPHSIPSYGQANGTYSQQTTPRHHHDSKPMVQQQHYPPGQKPQIYTVCLPQVALSSSFNYAKTFRERRLFTPASRYTKWR